MELERRNIAVVITGLRAQPRRMLKRINIIPGLIPEHYTFKTFQECVGWIEQELSDMHTDDMPAFFDELHKKSERLVPRFQL